MSIAMVVPCFNEAQRFDIEYWTEVTELTNCNWIFVDDGSVDQTYDVLQRFCSDKHKVIRLQKNAGKAEAIRIGILDYLSSSSDASVIGFIDADSAFSSRDVARILSIAGKMSQSPDFYSLWASRAPLAGRTIQRKLSRHYIGRFVATVLSLGVDDVPYDTQCGFKLFARNDHLIEMLEEPFLTRWFFDVEILFRLRNLNPQCQIWEEPLRSWIDVEGSKVSMRNSLAILSELLKIKRLQLKQGPN